MAKTIESEQWEVRQEMSIPYYEETQKRTFRQKLRKIKNTLCFLLAYACPNNKIRITLHRWRGVHIGKNVYLGMFVFLDNLYPEYIYIEDGASVNAGSMILTHFNPMKQYAPIMQARVAPAVIRKNAIVTIKSTILPGVMIGQNAIVSAGSVVEKSVPPFTIVKGVPAKKVAEFESLMNID